VNSTDSKPNKVVVVDDVQTNLTVFAKVVAQLPETEAVCFTDGKEGEHFSMLLFDWPRQNNNIARASRRQDKAARGG